MARHTLSIRLSDAEKQTLTIAAERAGVPLSVYVRTLAVKGAGGVSSEWRTGPPPAPLWAAGLLRAIRRTIRRELEAPARRGRGSPRARPSRA